MANRIWEGMQAEMEGLAQGLQTVALNLEALNSRVEGYLQDRIASDSSNAPTFRFGLTQLAELNAKLQKMYVAPEAVIHDTADLCAACVGELDGVVAVGSALAAHIIVYEQLAVHYRESEIALRAGVDTVKALKRAVMGALMGTATPQRAPASPPPPPSATASAKRIPPAVSVTPPPANLQGTGEYPEESAEEHPVARPKKKKAAKHSSTHQRTLSTHSDASASHVDAGPNNDMEQTPPPLDSGHLEVDGTAMSERAGSAGSGMDYSSRLGEAGGHKLRKRKLKLDTTPEPVEQPMQIPDTLEVHASSNDLHASGNSPKSAAGDPLGDNVSITSSEARSRSLAMSVVTAPFTATKFVAQQTGQLFGGALRNTQMKLLAKRFPEVAEEEILDITNCAWSEGTVLKQGYWYITSRHIAFVATVLKAAFCLSFNDIKEITKQKNAMVFDNAIAITTRTGETYFMTSFLKRDDAFDVLWRQWAQ